MAKRANGEGIISKRRRGHKEGTIVQRSDGRWMASMQVGYEGGKRNRKTFYGRTRAEVQEKLTDALSNLRKGISPVLNERLTLGAFLLGWLEGTVKRKVRASTYRGYESKIRTHLIPALGTVALVKLTPERLNTFFNEELTVPPLTRTKLSQAATKQLSPQTVKHLRAILRAALNDAVKWSLIHRNVATLVDGPTVPYREVQVPSPDEARGLLEAAQSHRLGGLFTLCLATGLRQGEALGLHWPDIDLESGTLTVRRALQRIEGEFRFVEPKTRSSRRDVPIPAIAIAALHRHRARQREERLVCGSEWQDSGLVFTTATGRPLQGTAVTRDFQALLAQTGLRRLRFHDLRHACASLLLAQGAHPRVIMETLGHSRIDLTMNTYAHVIPALRREAADMIDLALTSAR
jgi:integrase